MGILWYDKYIAFYYRISMIFLCRIYYKGEKMQNDNGNIRYDKNNCTYAHSHAHTQSSLNIRGSYGI